MHRLQVQLPKPLYERIRQIAKHEDVSIADVMRRGAAYIASCYPPFKFEDEGAWEPPTADVGPIVTPAGRMRELVIDQAVDRHTE